MTPAEHPEGERNHVPRPRGRPYRHVANVRSASMLGLGMIVGAVLGAGVALLVAPQSGAEARRFIARRAGGLRRRGGVWTRLGLELRRAAAAKRKALEMEARRNESEARRAAREEARPL
jgi:gas vesicle protein